MFKRSKHKEETSAKVSQAIDDLQKRQRLIERRVMRLEHERRVYIARL
jgi:hypothetical protein